MPWMASIPTGDLRCYSPFRPADWRWREAQHHLTRNTSPRAWEDAGIVRAHQFLLALSNAGTEARQVELTRCWPDLAPAHTVFARAGLQQNELEARLICEPVDVISGKMSISLGVVNAYADTFFDVLDSINALDWMMMQAVGVHRFSLPPTEAECWRYLAFAGGPFVLDLMVADYFGRPEPYYPDRHRLAERARFLVRDHVSLMQTGRSADREIVEEHCRIYRENVRTGRRKPDPQIALHLKLLRLAAKLPRCREIEQSLPKGSLPRQRSQKGNIKEQQPQARQNVTPSTPGAAVGQTCEHRVNPDSLVPVSDQSAGLGVNAS
jgi:hypothetical protein